VDDGPGHVHVDGMSLASFICELRAPRSVCEVCPVCRPQGALIPRGSDTITLRGNLGGRRLLRHERARRPPKGGSCSLSCPLAK